MPEPRRLHSQSAGALAGTSMQGRSIASFPTFLDEVMGSVTAAGFPIWNPCDPNGGVRVWTWPSPGGGPAANLQWNLHDRLHLEDENGFPVMELVMAVNQVLGLALEMQGFEVLSLDTEILVRPGGK